MPKSSQNIFDVIVVGAGFAGMQLLVRLGQIGLSAIALERASGVGGTWYWNCYPGARCDIESLQYSCQFSDELQQEWNWSERYAGQPEILRYAEHIADRFELREQIRLGTNVASAVFAEDRVCWEVTSESGEQFGARFLIMATGCLSQPNWPRLPGFETFAGKIYHTGQWPKVPVDFNNRRVGVIGTGSSAIQVIPQLARQVESLTVFQRTANYSIPAHNRPLDTEEISDYKARYAQHRQEAKQTPRGVAFLKPQKLAAETGREEILADLEWRWQIGGLAFLEGFSDLTLKPELNEIAAEFARSKIRAIVNDKKTANSLCPTNIIGGKRLCVDTDYFETYNLPQVELIDLNQTELLGLDANGLSTTHQYVELDDLVIATGFDAMTGALLNIDIVGRGGLSLRRQWQNGPETYLGLAMAGFPNLFTVTGPGSPSVLTNVLVSIDQQVNWIGDCLQHMKKRDLQIIEATRDAERAWWEQVQELASKSLRSKLKSWYIGSNVEGKPAVFTPYVGGFQLYSEICNDIASQGYRGFHFE